MPFVGELVDPRSPDSLADWARGVAEALNAGLSFGDPTHPVDPSQFPNGQVDNVRGSFALARFEATDSALSVAHNLALDTVGVGPNVAWFLLGLRHDGTGVLGGDEPISIEYREGDAVGADAIELRAMAAGGRTVDATHPLRALLFFIAVTPW